MNELRYKMGDKVRVNMYGTIMIGHITEIRDDFNWGQEFKIQWNKESLLQEIFMRVRDDLNSWIPYICIEKIGE